LIPLIQAIRSTGAVTLRDMTEALNQRGADRHAAAMARLVGHEPYCQS